MVQVMEEIVQRTASAMVDRGIPFSGVLFAGLMIKDGKVGSLLIFQPQACNGSLSAPHYVNYTCHPDFPAGAILLISKSSILGRC